MIGHLPDGAWERDAEASIELREQLEGAKKAAHDAAKAKFAAQNGQKEDIKTDLIFSQLVL